MAKSTKHFEVILDRVNVTFAFALPMSLITIITAMMWLFAPSYYQTGSFNTFLIIMVIILVTGFINYFYIEKLNPRNARPIYVAYFVGLAAFCILVAPYLSPYNFLWIMLTQSVDLIYRKAWMYLPLAAYGLTVVASFFSTSQTLSIEIIGISLLQAVAVCTISILFSKLRRVSDEERQVMDHSARETAFERQRLLSLINNMGEAVIATDDKGKILLYNAAALNLLDTNQTLDDKPLDKILALKTEKYLDSVSIIEKARENPSGYTSRDLVHEFAKDDRLNIYVNISPIKLGFKEKSEDGFIVLLRDITKEKSLEDERDEFISVISHELRTPIAIAEGDISNALFITEKNHDPKTVTISLTQAHDQIVFLASMVNDLATLSRAERTDVKMELAEIKPDELLELIYTDYKNQAKDKSLKLTLTTAKNIKPVKTSELYLREILQNFITNAIKYTKKGQVLLHVRSNKNGDAVFSVTDTGIGLSKSDQKRIFEKFFRSEDFRTRETSGTGLGLYVTSKLANRIEAKIELESQLNKGSTFTITVPSLD